jgi:hypothetical protein
MLCRNFLILIAKKKNCTITGYLAKMKKLTGSQIVSEFIRRLNTIPNYSVTGSSISRNVFRLSGDFESLIYVKGRAEEPHRWGVTKNVVERLED